MLERIVSTLENDGAVTFPPAGEKAVTFVGSMLSSHGFARVPGNYADFLKLSDGLMWNGVELYGTRAVDRELLGYVFPGLIEANLNYLGYGPLQGRLVLGRAAEEIFVFDAREKRYQILERLSFQTNGAFPAFSDLIYLFVDELF